RGEGLAPCPHLSNTPKAEVPIWKEQHFASGGSEWVGLPDEDGEMRAAPVEAQDSALRQAQGSELNAQGIELQAEGAQAQAQSTEAQAQRGVREAGTRQAWAAFVSALAFICLAVLLVVVPVPFVSWTPGGTRDTLGNVGNEPMIKVEGIDTYPTTGQLDMTIVAITPA